MIPEVVAYLLYAFCSVALCVATYTYYTRRQYGVLVKPRELKDVREFRRHRDDYMAWRQLPDESYPKSMARQITDRWNALQVERDEAQAVAAGLEWQLKRNASLLEEYRDTRDAAWRVADFRLECWEAEARQARKLQAQLDERDEDLDEAKNKIAQLEQPTWTWSAMGNEFEIL